VIAIAIAAALIRSVWAAVVAAPASSKGWGGGSSPYGDNHGHSHKPPTSK